MMRCNRLIGISLGVILLLATTINADDSQLIYCDVIQKTVKADEEQQLRILAQSLQAAESYLGQEKLGRSTTASALPNNITLTQWRDAAASGLQSTLQSSGLVEIFGSSPPAATLLATSCLTNRLDPYGFIGRPLVSILVNYFKRPQVVRAMAKNMSASCAAAGVRCELVVNVDNPHEAEAWAAETAAASGFVVPVFSANLHEARGYNRAARLARGSYLVIWQDDQIPLENGAWLTDMVKVFEAHPLLGILGMNKYRLCRQKERTNRDDRPVWEPDPATNVTWTYVQLTDFAPMAVRASAFWDLGGLEEGWSRPGDCGITGDWEFCMRAWVAGWQVGHMIINGREQDHSMPGGTHHPVTAEQCWGRQAHVGRSAMDKRYIRPVFFDQMCERAWALNMVTFKLRNGATCPYGDAMTRYGNCTAPGPRKRSAMAAALNLPERW